MACRSPVSRHGRSRRRPIVLDIDSLAFGGDAVGRDDDGRVVFVPLAAPGDRVEVNLTEEKKGFARGELVRVISSGPARAHAPCPLFGRCGGCQWQHVSYPDQLAAKSDVVARALRAEVARGAVLEPALAAPSALGYRRRARLAVRPGRAGAPPVMGFRARRSHEVIDVPRCLLLEPALDEALTALRQLLLPTLERPCTVDVLLGREGVHVHVDAPIDLERARELVGQAGIVGLVVDTEPGQGDPVVLGAAGVDLAEPGEAPLVARAGDFAQAQQEQNRALQALVAEWAAPQGARVLELYAGAGNLTRALLAAGASWVDAVEENEEAVRSAALGLAGAQLRFRAGRAETALEAAGPTDVLVLDPPRTGALEVMQALVGQPSAAATPRIAPERVIYVSCDPMTLARDAAVLTGAGYVLERARAIDMMPQTFHVEVVAKLVRAPH